MANALLKAGEIKSMQEVAHVIPSIKSAISRDANETRQQRTVGLTPGGKKKYPQHSGEVAEFGMIRKIPKTPFYEHDSDLRNQQDLFITRYVHNAAIGKDPTFLKNFELVKVSFLFSEFI